eukprot:9498015-Pyramimonas_sp.AAC.1
MALGARWRATGVPDRRSAAPRFIAYACPASITDWNLGAPSVHDTHAARTNTARAMKKHGDGTWRGGRTPQYL